MSELIRRLSDELARDPASLVFLQLGEALRRTSQLDLAQKVALRGLDRHPHNADAHDLLARIYVDRGELERAFDEWDMVLRLAPTHVGARKGMGYILFKQGKIAEAEEHLAAAAEHDSDDATIATALAMVRHALETHTSQASGRRQFEAWARKNGVLTPTNGGSPRNTPSSQDAIARPRLSEAARWMFAAVLADAEQTALLLDKNGLVIGGTYPTAEGRDVAQEVGAELSGVRDEAHRAARHLEIGAWKTIVFETDVATIALAPVGQSALQVVAASASLPLGFVGRVLDKCVERSTRWLSEGE